MNWRTSLLIWSISAFAVSCGSESETTKTNPAEYASTECLIEAEELAKKRASINGMKLIDLRKPAEFTEGHISGALNVWRDQITDTTYRYDGMMPTRSQMEILLSQLGIRSSDTIVIYDDKAECDAARLWWILKFYGHSHIKLLNGGLKAWTSTGGDISTEMIKPQLSDYHFTANSDSSILALHEEVVKSLLDTDIFILDTRGLEEHIGSKHKDGAARPGRIDSAKNLDWAEAVDYNGSQRFLPADELRAKYAAIGLNGDKPVITYCHSGVRSAHTLFVLTELLGYRNIKNYDGSWIEWSHIRSE
ncbi:MAG: hypothetical protein K9J17_10070 [Flavobacteriales bacterium]|nr:hypothetical protein [Flavobacteriales bacterium]